MSSTPSTTSCSNFYVSIKSKILCCLTTSENAINEVEMQPSSSSTTTSSSAGTSSAATNTSTMVTTSVQVMK